MPDIPPIDFWALENGNVIFSYQDLLVKLISLTKDKNKQDINKEIKVFSCIRSKFLDDLYKGNWQNKSGDYYHIDHINRAKQNLAIKIWSNFNPPPTLVTTEEYLRINYLVRIYWRLGKALNNICCFLLLQNKVLSAIFWILVLRGYKINEDGYLESDK